MVLPYLGWTVKGSLEAGALIDNSASLLLLLLHNGLRDSHALGSDSLRRLNYGTLGRKTIRKITDRDPGSGLERSWVISDEDGVSILDYRAVVIVRNVIRNDDRVHILNYRAVEISRNLI